MTMLTITLEEAQAQLTKLIEQLHPGEEIVITRHGRPVARVAPVEQPKKPSEPKPQQMPAQRANQA